MQQIYRIAPISKCDLKLHFGIAVLGMLLGNDWPVCTFWASREIAIAGIKGPVRKEADFFDENFCSKLFFRKKNNYIALQVY